MYLARMGETDSTEPETREITLTYAGTEWTHHVLRPTEGQTVQIMGLINAKGLSRPDLTEEQERIYRARAIKHVQTAVALAAGLHANPEEWDQLTMSMADGTATAETMFDVILGALKAWDDAPQVQANRADRRAAPKARRA
jgi:hypothetical protein